MKGLRFTCGEFPVNSLFVPCYFVRLETLGLCKLRVSVGLQRVGPRQRIKFPVNFTVNRGREVRSRLRSPPASLGVSLSWCPLAGNVDFAAQKARKPSGSAPSISLKPETSPNSCRFSPKRSRVVPFRGTNRTASLNWLPPPASVRLIPVPRQNSDRL